MAKIETAIRDAIARGTRKQIRLIAGPTRRELRRLRQLVRRLRGDVAALRGVAVQWQQAAARPRPLEVTEAESKAARLSPRLIRRLRTRLGLSQAMLGRLVGVSPTAIVQWERGRTAPSGRNRSALVAVRKLGRRDVKRRLAGLGTPAKARRAPSKRARRRRPRRARS